MTRPAHQVVYGPMVSEKSYQLYQAGKYTFRVDPGASKTEIAKALEQAFSDQKIKVIDVHTVSMPGKKRRVGRLSPGSTSEWKKAIVTLAEGQRLEGLFGGI